MWLLILSSLLRNILIKDILYKLTQLAFYRIFYSKGSYWHNQINYIYCYCQHFACEWREYVIFSYIPCEIMLTFLYHLILYHWWRLQRLISIHINFNPHPPCGGWQQKYTIRKNFSFLPLLIKYKIILLIQKLNGISCSCILQNNIFSCANTPAKQCSLHIRTKTSTLLPHPNFLLLRNAQS